MAKNGKYGGSVQRQGGAGGGGHKTGTDSAKKNDCTDLKMSNEMRSDMSGVTKKDPYPKGLA